MSELTSLPACQLPRRPFGKTGCPAKIHVRETPHKFLRAARLPPPSPPPAPAHAPPPPSLAPRRSPPEKRTTAGSWRIYLAAPRTEPKTKTKTSRDAQRNAARGERANASIRASQQLSPPLTLNTRVAATSRHPSTPALISDDHRGARRPSPGIVARPHARETARPPLSHGGSAAAGAQGPRLARGGGARVCGGGGSDRAHAVGQTREEDTSCAPRVPPPTAVFEHSLFIRRSWR